MKGRLCPAPPGNILGVCRRRLSDLRSFGLGRIPGGATIRQATLFFRGPRISLPL